MTDTIAKIQFSQAKRLSLAKPSKCYIPDMRNIRIKKLKELISTRFDGVQVDFAKAISRSPSQVNQWLAEYRPIGNGVARHIETTFKLKQGWMDGADESGDPSIDALLAIFDKLDDSFKKVALEQLKALSEVQRK